MRFDRIGEIRVDDYGRFTRLVRKRTWFGQWAQHEVMKVGELGTIGPRLRQLSTNGFLRNPTNHDTYLDFSGARFQRCRHGGYWMVGMSPGFEQQHDDEYPASVRLPTCLSTRPICPSPGELDSDLFQTTPADDAEAGDPFAEQYVSQGLRRRRRVSCVHPPFAHNPIADDVLGPYATSSSSESSGTTTPITSEIKPFVIDPAKYYTNAIARNPIVIPHPKFFRTTYE